MASDAPRSAVTSPPPDLTELARAVETALTDVRGMPIDHRKRARAWEAVEAFPRRTRTDRTRRIILPRATC
jgi:hypothetical protein